MNQKKSTKQVNRENLLRMINYMEKVPKHLIDMSNFRNGDRSDVECKSVGCIIGWCTALDKENILKNYLDVQNNIRFEDWSHDFLNMVLILDYIIWEFMFGSHWSNKKDLIINRMKYVYYKNGLIDKKELSKDLVFWDLNYTESKTNELILKELSDGNYNE